MPFFEYKLKTNKNMKQRLLFTAALVLAGMQAWGQSGTCGDNLTWTLDPANGTLTISGTGEMDYNGGPPWFDYNSNIRTVIVEDGVTSIAGWAFQRHASLTQAVIGNDVATIGNAAFIDCTSLEQVTIGTSIAHIGSDAFNNTALYNDDSQWINNVLYIGNCLIEARTTISGDYKIATDTKAIADEAFNGCNVLTGIDIPNCVTGIGTSAFQDCSSLAQISIGSSITSIGNNAFEGCESLTQVAWNVTNMTDYEGYTSTPFYPIKNNITSFTFGDSVRHIPAFLCFGMSGLASTTIGSCVESIGHKAFTDCSRLRQITWNAANCEDFATAASPFYSTRERVTSFIFGETVRHIPAYLCQGMYNLPSITIPASVASIGDSAFDLCNALTQVTWNATQCEAFSPYSHPFSAYHITSFTLGENVRHIPSYLCYGMYNLTSMSIPNNVIDIGASAFEGCEALTTVTIGNSITSIGSSAFKSCTALTQVNIPNSVEEIESWAFYECTALEQVTIGDGVTTIGDYVFANCTSLTRLTLGKSLANIGESPFSQCDALEQVTWNAVNFEDFSYAYEAPYFNNEHITSFVFGESVQHIPAYLCHDMVALTSVTIPANVQSMGDGVFQNCNALANLKVEANTPPTIQENTFQGISTSLDITVPAGSEAAYQADPYWKKLFDLASGVLSGMCGEHLTWTLNTADSLLTISGTGAMTEYGDFSTPVPWNEYQTAIKTLTIEDGATSVADYAFSGCFVLAQVTLPASITYIGYETFNNCPALTAVHYAGDIAGWCGITFGSHASNPLYYASKLYIGEDLITELVVPDGITEIKDYAFRGYSALTQITLPGSVTNIGYSVFEGCTALTQANLGEGVESIGISAFRDCTALTQVNLGDEVESIGNSAFNGCSALVQMTLPASVTDLGDKTFANCSALTTMTVLATTPPDMWQNTFDHVNADMLVLVPGASLTDYEADSYWGKFTIAPLDGVCGENLTWAYADGTLTISGTGDMYDYDLTAPAEWVDLTTRIDTLSLPDGLTTIGNYAFDSCANLAYLTIPASMVSIGNYAFSHCTGLTGIRSYATYPPAITEGTFYDVDKSIIVYVPEDGLNDYKAHPMWGEFFNMRPFKAESNAVPNIKQQKSIFVMGNEVHINRMDMTEAHVFDLQGRLILRTTETCFTLPQGLFLIQAGSEVMKVAL